MPNIPHPPTADSTAIHFSRGCLCPSSPQVKAAGSEGLYHPRGAPSAPPPWHGGATAPWPHQGSAPLLHVLVHGQMPPDHPPRALTERAGVVGAVHPAVGVQLKVEADAHPAVQPAPPPPRAAPREATRPCRRGGGGKRRGVAFRRPRLRPAGHLLPPGAGGQGEEGEEEEKGRAHAAGGREGAASRGVPAGETGTPLPATGGFISGRRPRTCARPRQRRAPPAPAAPSSVRSRCWDSGGA